MFSLLALSGDSQRVFQDHRASLGEAQQGSILQLLGHAYGIALSQLMKRGGLRGLHETKHARLKDRIRGKIQIGKYLTEYSSGRPNVFPCSFPSHTQNNWVNQLLLHALRAISTACRVGGEQLPLLDKLASAFAGVTLDPTARYHLPEAIKLPSAFDHYRDIGVLDLARLIVRGLNIGTGGGAFSTVAIAIPMHLIFEAAFARFASTWSGLPLEQIVKRKWRISISGSSGAKGGTFVPDVVLTPSRNRLGLVADTKWKSNIARGTQSDLGGVFLSVAGIKLYNADIYQIIGYIETARKIYGGDFVGVLIYPVSDVTDSDLEPLRLTVGSTHLPVYFLPWDVGKQCIDRLPAMWKKLESLRIVPTSAIGLQGTAVHTAATYGE